MRQNQKCSVCGEKEAVIFVKVFIEGHFEERALCATCAIAYLENKDSLKKLDFVDQRLLSVIEEMRGLISGIISNISTISSIIEKNGDTSFKCPYCETSYESFQESGFLGCPRCYDVFADSLHEFFLEVERGSTHRGKMPQKYGQIYLLSKEIAYLKNQLRKSVFDENYEKAERIKKRLLKLSAHKEIGRLDEFH